LVSLDVIVNTSASEALREADPALRPLVHELHARLTDVSPDLSAIKRAMIALLEFLSSPAGRTDANCRAVDRFFFLDESWLSDRLPEAYHDIIAHMDALHDTVSAPHVAQNFDSATEQLLARARSL
jgi:hypothetical protein